MAGRIFTADHSFSIEWQGKPLVVEAGRTAREGHPLLEAYPHFFSELKPDFEHTPLPPPAPKPAAKPVTVKPPAAPKKDADD
jgi:hypothetical protein